MKNIGIGLLVIIGAAWALWSFCLGIAMVADAPEPKTYLWLNATGPFWFWFAVVPWIAAGVGFIGLCAYSIGEKVRDL